MFIKSRECARCLAHLFVCLCWTAAAMTLPGKMSKQTQEGGRRMQEGEANNERWSMTQALWEHWSSHSGGGGGWFITSVRPTITDPQLIPTTKEVTMASQRTATHPNTTTLYSQNNTSQSSWDLPFHTVEAKPVWHPTPVQKMHNKEVSQDPACLQNNRKFTSYLFRLFSMSAFGQMFVLRTGTDISNDTVKYSMPSCTQYFCLEEMGECSVNYFLCSRNFSSDGHTQRNRPVTI